MSSCRRVERGVELVEALEQAGITSRLVGGVAIYLTCPSARELMPLRRDYSDIDVVVKRKNSRNVTSVLTEMSLRASASFNALHGHTRLLFEDLDGSHVDIFIESLSMCHRLHLDDRLGLAPLTLSPADLLLSKLQVIDLSGKDVQDMGALLLDNSITNDDDGINGSYIANLLSRNWGWWRTATSTLVRLPGLMADLLYSGDQYDIAQQRIHQLMAHITANPKTLGWKMRARIGERLPWHDDPEEL